MSDNVLIKDPKRREITMVAKTPEQLNLKPVRSHPEDIIKGFTDLGYDIPDIDKQFEFHKSDLNEGNEPGLNDKGEPITDEDVYGYMRSHLEDGGILPNVEESLNHYAARLGRHPSNEEYRGWIKPKIAQRVKEYRDQKMDEKSALAELDDEFGYDDLVREAYYGHPRRSDIQVWRDRAKKYAADVGELWPGFTEHYTNLNDDDIQELIDVFGFNRKGEW